MYFSDKLKLSLSHSGVAVEHAAVNVVVVEVSLTSGLLAFSGNSGDVLSLLLIWCGTADFSKLGETKTKRNSVYIVS